MNDRPPSINEPGHENLDRNILRNEIHVFLSETGWGIFNRNSGEISSGIDKKNAAIGITPYWTGTLISFTTRKDELKNCKREETIKQNDCLTDNKCPD